MIQSFFVALSTLCSVSGIQPPSFSQNAYIKNDCVDYSNIAAALNTTTIEKSSGEISIVGVSNINDLYAINGANQYLEVQTDCGYLIYDKISKLVVESDLFEKSPFSACPDDFIRLYIPKENSSGYLAFDGKQFQVIAEKNKTKNEPGHYYAGITPDSDATFIANSFFFENLKNGHGNNYNNICGIVSAEILFNYYDTFKNDTIVDEEYEIHAVSEKNNNPMLLNYFDRSPATGTNNEYDSKGQRFVEKLVSVFQSEIGHTPVGNGVYTREQIRFVKKYLNDRNIDSTIYDCEGNWGDRINQQAIYVIKSAINHGRPVIANGTGHSVVAYGYDSNYVYVHTGWGRVAATPWSTYETGMFDFEYDVGAIDIVINNHVHSDNYYSSYYHKYYCPCGLALNSHIFTPDSYEYESQYFFYEKIKAYTFDDCAITTKRLRCGYIEDSFINLSAIRQNAGTAYLEYSLNANVTKMITNVSYWGTKEYFSDTARIEIQYWNKNTSSWELLYDLKEKISDDRTNQTKLQLFFPEYTTRFRFFVSDNPSGSSNRGRLSIGDTELIYY